MQSNLSPQVCSDKASSNAHSSAAVQAAIKPAYSADVQAAVKPSASADAQAAVKPAASTDAQAAVKPTVSSAAQTAIKPNEVALSTQAVTQTPVVNNSFAPYYGLDLIAYESREVLPDGEYVIQAGTDSALAIDVNTPDATNSINVELRAKEHNMRQHWVVKHDALGYITLINARTGKALDVYGATAKPRTNVQQYNSNGSLAQKWIAVCDTATGRDFVLRSALDFTLALDVYDGSKTAGANIWVCTANGSIAQRFTFVRAPGATSPTAQALKDGYYSISSALNSDYALDGGQDTSKQGAAVQLQRKSNGASQMFKLRYVGGYYTLTNAKTGKLLDIAGASLALRASASQYSDSGSETQLWSIVQTGSYFTLVNRASGYALDVYDGKAKAGAHVWQYKVNHSMAQAWFIDEFKPLNDGDVCSIRNSESDNLAVAVAGSSKAAGANVQMQTYSQKFSEKWVAHYISAQRYAFESLASGMFLGANGSNVCQIARQSDGATTWDLVPGNAGFRFVNAKNGQVMTVSGGKVANGGNVAMHKMGAGNVQEFKFAPESILEEKAYVVQLAGNGRLLDVRSGSNAEGAAVQLFHNNGGAAQKWFALNNYDGTVSLLCVKSGHALSYGAIGSSGAAVTQKSVGAGRALGHRWKVVPKGDGAFSLITADNSSRILAVRSGNDYADAVVLDEAAAKATASLARFEFKEAPAAKPSNVAARVTRIAMSGGSAMKVAWGAWTRIAVDLAPRVALGGQLDFVSADPTIVSVDAHGTARALRPGTTTVTATLRADANVHASVSVTVTSEGGFITERMLGGLNLDAVDSLMIVAHPDDETFWGGAHLLQGKYLVVCMTNGSNPVRSVEFNKAMDISKSQRLILSYPDSDDNGVRDTWANVSKGAANDIARLLAAKRWKVVATHNPNGDTGHIHHKAVNKLVTSACQKAGYSATELHYFGKFYAAGSPQLASLTPNVTGGVLKRKLQMVACYPAEASAYNSYWKQMMPHEHWVSKAQWKA